MKPHTCTSCPPDQLRCGCDYAFFECEDCHHIWRRVVTDPHAIPLRAYWTKSSKLRRAWAWRFARRDRSLSNLVTFTEGGVIWSNECIRAIDPSTAALVAEQVMISLRLDFFDRYDAMDQIAKVHPDPQSLVLDVTERLLDTPDRRALIPEAVFSLVSICRERRDLAPSGELEALTENLYELANPDGRYLIVSGCSYLPVAGTEFAERFLSEQTTLSEYFEHRRELDLFNPALVDPQAAMLLLAHLGGLAWRLIMPGQIQREPQGLYEELSTQAILDYFAVRHLDQEFASAFFESLRDKALEHNWALEDLTGFLATLESTQVLSIHQPD